MEKDALVAVGVAVVCAGVGGYLAGRGRPAGGPFTPASAEPDVLVHKLDDMAHLYTVGEPGPVLGVWVDELFVDRLRQRASRWGMVTSPRKGWQLELPVVGWLDLIESKRIELPEAIGNAYTVASPADRERLLLAGEALIAAKQGVRIPLGVITR